MRVFVTGAAGFIGTAVCKELLAHGHEVLGLARNDANAANLSAAGVSVHRGDLTDPDSLAAGARAADGVIHLAFNHDFSRWAENIIMDRRANEVLIEALSGSSKPFVGTSGTAVATPGTPAMERDRPYTGPGANDRGATEQVVLDGADRGVRASTVRLTPTVHAADETHGFIPMLVTLAREKGMAAYVGDGANRWPAVHRDDAASCFRLALERGAGGTRFHAVAEEGVPMRTIQEQIGKGLGVPVRSLTPDEAAAHFGWMAHFVALDNPSSSATTRDILGWQPSHPDLLADLRDGGYFG